MANKQGKKKTVKGQKKWLFYVTVGLLLVLLCLVTLLIWKIMSSQDESVEAIQGKVNQRRVAPVVQVPFQPIDEREPRRFAVKKPQNVTPPPVELKVLATPQVTSGVALIIDDMGYDVHALKRLLALSIPLAISILPNTPRAVEVANITHQAGHLVMLHVPMEPMGEHYRNRMDASFLKVGMDKASVRATLLGDLAKIPYIQGMNNHMGSRLTSMIEPMTWVMQICREKSLFFVDSKTSSKSLAATVAKQYGLAWGARTIFLDDSVKPAAMKKAWQSLERCVRRQQRCIVIAHPHKQTLAFLEKKLEILQRWPVYPLDSLLHPSQQ